MSAVLETISPQREIGAYEALWAGGINTFKQVRDKLVKNNALLASEVVSPQEALKFYQQAMGHISRQQIENWGVRIDGTFDYPVKLHDADHPLLLLYFQGTWDLALTRGISVVGTRKPSPKGKERTERLVKELVEKKFTIFSGLASGIDTIAHKTALKCNGKTVAVLGTPLSHTYPKENLELQREIAKKHLVISQVPFVRYNQSQHQFNRFYFPERNKTMSALAEATIIIEAGETSGTLIQARAALKQNRKLFILNNCFENKSLSWPQKFADKGAIRVQHTDDILRALDS